MSVRSQSGVLYSRRNLIQTQHTNSGSMKTIEKATPQKSLRYWILHVKFTMLEIHSLVNASCTCLAIACLSAWTFSCATDNAARSLLLEG